MSIPCQSEWSSVSSLNLKWFNCSNLVEPKVVAVGMLPGMKFKTTWSNLEQDLSILSRVGFTDVFCLCRDSELSFFRVRELFDGYRQKDIRVHHYPIKPDVSPDYKYVRDILLDLWNTLQDGKKFLFMLRALLEESVFYWLLSIWS